MGTLSAMAMTDEELGLSLEEQIGLHFKTNCYPPVPASMIPVSIEALDSVNEGHFFVEIPLPEGVLFRGGTTAPAWEIVDQHRLYAWVIESELDYEED